jgi:hypothetical protein
MIIRNDIVRIRIRILLFKLGQLNNYKTVSYFMGLLKEFRIFWEIYMYLFLVKEVRSGSGASPIFCMYNMAYCTYLITPSY